MNAGVCGRPIEILLVEDNRGDVRLASEAFKEAKIINRLHVVRNGSEALDFLRRKETYFHAPHPDLILLDLNLPKKDGREVLAEIKQDEELRHIPVVVLTVSEDENDIRETYDLHANCYIRKPVGFEQFMTVVRSIQDFWFAVVTLPPDGAK